MLHAPLVEGDIPPHCSVWIVASNVGLVDRCDCLILRNQTTDSNRIEPNWSRAGTTIHVVDAHVSTDVDGGSRVLGIILEGRGIGVSFQSLGGKR